MIEPFLIGGAPKRGAECSDILDPYAGRRVGTVARAGPSDLDEAIATAAAAAPEMAALPAWRRAEILYAVAARVGAETESLARTIALEAGKPLKQARAEVERTVLTCRTAAEEATRIEGRLLPLDVARGMEGRFGLLRRFPVGPVALVTPFNFPLNLVAHKVAPAIAAGCPFVLKPASKTPLSALAFARIVLECGCPAGAVSVVPVDASEAAALVEDPRLKALSFTGSPEVGWDMRRRAGRKKVVLELGGNAGVIVDRSADVPHAAARIAAGGFAHAGQSCVSVQRVFVHAEIRAAFEEALLAAAHALRVGDPLDPSTDVGPLISEAEARRVESWIEEARGSGARVLLGGERDGAVIAPAVIVDAAKTLAVCAREAFAPLVVVESFVSVEAAVRDVDDSTYGLQAGIFTRDLGAMLTAYERIAVGAVIVNDVPTWRADPMPYGGVKASGTGREGPRYAIEDFTEPRLLVVVPPTPGQL
jgi:acyl-CoA reductase-like NAD-dependent aldehyde dehydrogenase